MGEPIMVAEGTACWIELFDDRIRIGRKGMLHSTFSGSSMFKGPKEMSIPLSKVATVRFKAAEGWGGSGYVQFLYDGQVLKDFGTYDGRLEGIDDGKIAFFNRKQQSAMERLKSAVEERVAKHAPERQQREPDLKEWMGLLREGNVSVRLTIEGGSSEVVLKDKEELQVMLPNMAFWEARSVRTSGGMYGGPSFRVAKGMSLRVGAFGSESSSYDELREIDRGRLTLTNQRLVFTGARRTSEIKLDKIVSVAPYSDGIAVQASGHSKTQCFVGIDPTQLRITANVNERSYPVEFTGLILDCMIEGLIKKQEETSKQSSPKELEQGAVHGHDVPDQIRELGKLRDSGLITAEEFERKKRELLDRM